MHAEHEVVAQQRKKSLQASQFNVDYTQQLQLEQQTYFSGYETLQENEVLLKTD